MSKSLTSFLALVLIGVLSVQPFMRTAYVARADESTSTAAVSAPADAGTAATDTSAPTTGTTPAATSAPASRTTTDVSAANASTSPAASTANTNDTSTTTPTVPDTTHIYAPQPTDTDAASSSNAVSTSSDTVLPGAGMGTNAGGSTSTPAIPDMPTIQTFGSSTAATSTSSSSWPLITPLPEASTTDATNTVTVSTTTTATSTGPTIKSGEAVALSNILNIVNTNLVNSSGNALLLNYVDPVTGAIDLRGNTGISSTSAICALFACSGNSGVSVNLNGDTGIHNAVVLNATSGGNQIDTAGNATINTGNAYAGLNLINLANTNIVDSNYLLVTMNAFQGVNGDIVFPSLTNLLTSLAHNLSPGTVTAHGNANVTNNVTADAQSGGNETSSTTQSSIQSGASASTGSVFNQINTNMIGGPTVSILFRVQGKWAGQIFGAPAGLQWAQGPDGTIALTAGGDGTGGTQSLGNITASSTGTISNDVNVLALTGQNKITNAGTALITTGNALASANVLNIANTNVVGKNWILAIVNIFGDFTGNIAFGRPDLWVGEQVTVPPVLSNGQTATYKYTVINNGDSPASDVLLTDAFDTAHIRVSTSSMPFTTDASGHAVWKLGTIPAGGAVEVTYDGNIHDAAPGTNITDTVQAAEHETDNNGADNTDTATISIPQLVTNASYFYNTIQSPDKDTVPATTTKAHISLSRDTQNSSAQGTGTVHEHLVLTNDSSAATIPLVVHDILYSPSGKAIHDEMWNVGSVNAGEGVELAYDTSFAADAPAGSYSLSTLVLDTNGNVLGTFAGNGSIAYTPSPLAAVWHTLTSHAPVSRTIVNHTREGSVLGAVFPDVAVAHAAGNGTQAAAAGLLNLSWQTLLALGLLILAVLFLVAARTRRRMQ